MLTKNTPHKMFFISEIFKSSWHIFKKQWLTIYAVQLLPVAVAMLYSFVQENMTKVTPAIGTTPFFTLTITLAYIFLQLVISMGLIRAYLNITRNEKVDVNTFSSQIPKSINFIVTQFLLMLLVIFGLILFIVPGIYFYLKYMFAPYLVVDKNLGPLEALKASGKLTDGLKWDLTGFVLAATILTYSGILLFFVGLIITIPVATLSYVVLYNKLKTRS
jgi:uncharacterized membrane protein